MSYSHRSPGVPPKECLRQLVQQQAQQIQQSMEQRQQQQPQMPNGVIHPGGPPPGPHPGMMHSPSANDMRMGGSPHVSVGAATPSPAQNPMQAPGMVQQHSQHQHPTSNPSSQTSTTVGSANTSPNQTNKRRRASTTSNVKPDGEDAGGGAGDQQPNGISTKVKQSPRGNKRAKLGAQNS